MTTAANRPGLLSLRAEDDDDLKIVSAQLQDALVPIADMAFLAGEQAFVMVVNRFMWDHALAVEDREGEPVFLRTNCGVRFCGVRAVRYRGFDRGDRRLVLSLLAVEPDEHGVMLRFAGGADIRLDCDRPDCRMKDLDEPWPTRHRPHHPPNPLDGAADADDSPRSHSAGG
jgi:hypothetical protein